MSIDVDAQDVHHSNDHTLVITIGIANHNMHYILIDDGSLVNILSRVMLMKFLTANIQCQVLVESEEQIKNEKQLRKENTRAQK